MIFRKNKRVEWWIVSWRYDDGKGDWVFWDDAPTEKAAQGKWRDNYDSDHSFRVVRAEFTMLPMPGQKVKKAKKVKK